MNPIYIHFVTFYQHTDPRSYIEEALKGLFTYFKSLGGEGIAVKTEKYKTMADFVLENGFSGGSIPITPPAHFPDIDEAFERQIEVLIDCAKGIIEEVFPLLEGEKRISYNESFLEKDWKGFGRGCGVISRVTTLATVHFLFPNTMISDDGQLNRDAPIFPRIENRLSSRMKSEEGVLMSKAPFDSFVL